MFLAGMVFLAGAAGWWMVLAPNQEGHWVVILVGEREFGRYALGDSQVIVVPGDRGTVEVHIRSHTAWVERAECATQVCVRTGAISALGRVIVCVPNRVVIRIEGAQGGGHELITG